MSSARQTLELEVTLKARIRAELPPESFARHPWRALLAIPLVVLILCGSLGIVLLPLPWYGAFAASVLLGTLYASLFLFGHELAHGAMVRSGRLRNILLYPTTLIYCLSPLLWRVWHNQAHHCHTNIPDQDPDTFCTLDQFKQNRLTRALARFAPASGNRFSVLSLLTFFTLHSQEVLWRNSFSDAFRRLPRRRAQLDSVLMAGFWILVSVSAGPHGALFVVLVPMLVANLVVMSYIVTNHLMRPLVSTPDTLDTTVSVSTFKLIDLIFFHVSHHVEHHLFPSMSTCYYPLVRRALRRHAPGRYLAPAHWRALLLIFRTPRVYADRHTLVEPRSGRRVAIAAVETALRNGSTQARPAASPAGESDGGG